MTQHSYGQCDFSLYSPSGWSSQAPGQIFDRSRQQPYITPAILLLLPSEAPIFLQPVIETCPSMENPFGRLMTSHEVYFGLFTPFSVAYSVIKHDKVLLEWRRGLLDAHTWSRKIFYRYPNLIGTPRQKKIVTSLIWPRYHRRLMNVVVGSTIGIDDSS